MPYVLHVPHLVTGAIREPLLIRTVFAVHALGQFNPNDGFALAPKISEETSRIVTHSPNQ